MKKFETSKIFLFVITLLSILTIAFSFYQIHKTENYDLLTYIVPSVFAELGAATGCYYIKAKNENKIKIILGAVEELSQKENLTEEQVRIIEALTNNLNS